MARRILIRMTDKIADIFRFDPEVRDALAAARPVVALESTVISHGLPYPRNLETAAAMSDAVRAAGAIPAIIAVSGGFVRIGLDDKSLERFARSGEVEKLSRRDLGACLASGADGATTVAATMILAQKAGIKVFATGGIGGVHRGASESFDISADLSELSRTPVLVVASGAKSILDLPKTLEVLEALGVPVLCEGTDELPAFQVRESGIPAPRRIDGAAAIAGVAKAHWALELGGLLVCNPAPAEAALPRQLVEDWITTALDEAEANGIIGKAVTPYLLGRIAEASGGRTIDANHALLLDNARLAGEIACAYYECAG